MTKEEFLTRLRKGLSGLPQDDIEERLTFYGEMIDDGMEEGLSEEEAVQRIGNIDEIVSQTVSDIPLAKLVKEKITPKRQLKAWEILLLALGSPVWFSLLIAALAVVLSLYVSLWSVMIALWAAFGAIVVSAFGGVAGGIASAVVGNAPAGVALIGIALVCVGLSVFLFFGCLEATKGILRLTGRLAIHMKKSFAKKENV